MADINFSYIPILSLKPAEMAALEELPSKDKDLLLPLIPLKKWANSKSFDNTITRIEKAFEKRNWIADLDKIFLTQARLKAQNSDEKILNDFLSLSDPNNGYYNWFSFLKDKKNLIPTLQLENIDSLNQQIDNLLSLNRIIVVRFEFTGDYRIEPHDFNIAVKALASRNFPDGLIIILDYGDFNQISILEHQQYSKLINNLNSIFPDAYFSISGTSFPYSFANSYRGEIPIYERQIFKKVKSDCQNVKLIYSDRGSTRALANDGGAGTPPPRIDYPLKNDWRFIRKELAPDIDKEDLYKDAANEMMSTDYWNSKLRLWGTQMIEKTGLGDPFGITNQSRATAVRINLHLYQQLHYYNILDSIDTEEDWKD
ncbi:beta family protein [Dickeya chrysanthemi]|uniref:beta family protein n=1 Tax=Dickeya chrysanthemi TaxID=556 RepID=UPI001CF51CAA|nr:beta family protein [Dickeya chrysanthemi]MCA7008861.1 beta family protein [Dickeya chrysanthemi]